MKNRTFYAIAIASILLAVAVLYVVRPNYGQRPEIVYKEGDFANNTLIRYLQARREVMKLDDGGKEKILAMAKADLPNKPTDPDSMPEKAKKYIGIKPDHEKGPWDSVSDPVFIKAKTAVIGLDKRGTEEIISTTQADLRNSKSKK